MTLFKNVFSHAYEDNVRAEKRTPRHYWNPYLVGMGLGVVLLLTFVIMGRGLGASGALSTVVAATVNEVNPHAADNNQFYRNYIPENGESPFKDWLVFEVLGVVLGGFISGTVAGRTKIFVEKGPHISTKKRFLFAFIGGALMGFGAKMARGCTSGQGLTGGAGLSVGGWTFLLAVFIGAYGMAYFVRRQWI